MNTTPLTVDIIRGPMIESHHQVHALVMTGKGKIKALHGDADRPTFPRSAIKALQAIALVESGAAEAYQVSDAELALACASHVGEKIHTDAVRTWLARIHLTEDDLECGPQVPQDTPVAPAQRICNNCSGKHTGMLTLTMFLKQPTKGYTLATHPTQEKILKTISEMSGATVTAAECGVDGCSAPAMYMPLENFARGFAAFMNPQGLSAERALACRRIMRAVFDNPDMVHGTGKMDSVLMRASKGRIFAKGGAEGVYVLLTPEQDTVIVLKCEDGNMRATQAAVYHMLEKYGLADKETLAALQPLALPPIKNWEKAETGFVRVSG